MLPVRLGFFRDFPAVKFLGLTLLLSAFSAAASAQGPQLSGTLISPTYNNGVLSVTLKLTNSGASAADNIVITQLPLRVLTGTGPVTAATPPLPLSVGALASSASTNIPLTFNVTLPVSRFSLAETGTVQDSLGNSYNFSISELETIPSTLTLGFTPSSLTYAVQNTGTTSAAQSVTVNNTG